MLREIQNARQIPGDFARKLFADEQLDLTIWYNRDHSVFGFQLCYDPDGSYRALTWTPNRSFTHALIDAGEDSVHSNRSPVMTLGGECDPAQLRQLFHDASLFLPAAERALVEDRLAEWQVSLTARTQANHRARVAPPSLQL